MKYFVKTPWWLRKIFPSYLWHRKTTEKILYLSFDDGPHPVATPFVLEELRRHNAKATFFCIGKNVARYPELYERILFEGHSVGNHTYHHLNGWKTKDEDYVADVLNADELISSSLFRPPYGRITASQAKKIRRRNNGSDRIIVMWDIVSGDFDKNLNGMQCAENVIRNARPGSIIVCHDSEKAFSRIEIMLPEVLKFFSGNGYRFESLEKLM